MFGVWQHLPSIDTIICDVDGVLTNAGLRYGAEGEVVKVFHVRDGAAMKEAKAAGLRVVVISGRQHPALERRLSDLGIQDFRLGVGDKVAAASDLGVDFGLTLAIGDDLPDVPLLERVALSIAVADATPVLRRRVSGVTTVAGGHGAVAEVIGWWLQAQGRGWSMAHHG